MRKPQATDAAETSGKKPLWQRLGWLLAIWTGSVLALGLVSWLLRLFMNAAGLSTP
ncbi:DUF2474 domain-containing protein [Pseudomonas cavernicola]|uniref:DUF2474 domain-containing protein n=1 Tax=Pseudomonas cavernicola TaxID=2320866 RepID=A0A418XHV4_9PSED|nr:DUF2474 domain-containing protein [Pseudomonas cavernicola]RJG12021.1 DUF2474 domain-containing protein [Pseudomonas cavernicola]